MGLLYSPYRETDMPPKGGTRGGLCVFKNMFSFLHTIFDIIASFLFAVVIAVGLTAAPVATPTEPSAIATSSNEVLQQQIEVQSPIREKSEVQATAAELEAEKKKSQQLEQSLQQERKLRDLEQARQAAAEELKRQQELELARQAQLQAQSKNNTALSEVVATMNRIAATMDEDAATMKEYQQKVLTETAKFNSECGSYTGACYQSYIEIVKYYGDGYQALLKERNKLDSDYKQYDLLRLQILSQQ